MPRPQRRPKVAAGLIERTDQTLLIALPRGEGASQRRWQFPREPVRPAESPEAAMRRLARDRLGLEVELTIGQPPVLAQIDGQLVEMRHFHCTVASGELAASTYAETRWISKPHLREYEFDDVSQPVVDWLLANETP